MNFIEAVKAVESGKKVYCNEIEKHYLRNSEFIGFYIWDADSQIRTLNSLYVSRNDWQVE